MNEDIRVYSSDSTNKKSALKLLIIEIVTFIVVIIGITFVLINLNVLSISDILGRIGILNTQDEEKIISVKSISPEYSAILENHTEVEDFIVKSGILGKIYNEAGGGNTPLKSIEVVLSHTPQPNMGVFDDNRQRIASLALVFIDDKLEIHIHPDPLFATDTEKIGKALSSGFAAGIRTILNISTHKDYVPVDAKFKIEAI